MVKQRKGRYRGRDIIAVDESNNGFQKKGLPLIITSSFVENYMRSQQGNGLFEKKKFAYRPSKREEFVQRSREFLKRNPHFVYTTLSEKESERYGLYGRAIAMASTVSGAIERYNPKNGLVIVCHRIDDNSRTKFVEESLKDILEKAGIEARVEFRGGEDEFLPLRKADRSAYYIGGLRFDSGQKRWPWRTRKVRFDSIKNFDVIQPGKYDEHEIRS